MLSHSRRYAHHPLGSAQNCLVPRKSPHQTLPHTQQRYAAIHKVGRGFCITTGVPSQYRRLQLGDSRTYYCKESYAAFHHKYSGEIFLCTEPTRLKHATKPPTHENGIFIRPTFPDWVVWAPKNALHCRADRHQNSENFLLQVNSLL
jgi:hypothetical protein